VITDIGDIGRFRRPEQLASWAGPTPKPHESDIIVHRGRITKQGSRLVRRAAVEPVQRGVGEPRRQRRACLCWRSLRVSKFAVVLLSGLWWMAVAGPAGGYCTRG